MVLTVLHFKFLSREIINHDCLGEMQRVGTTDYVNYGC